MAYYDHEYYMIRVESEAVYLRRLADEGHERIKKMLHHAELLLCHAVVKTRHYSDGHYVSSFVCDITNEELREAAAELRLYIRRGRDNSEFVIIPRSDGYDSSACWYADDESTWVHEYNDEGPPPASATREVILTNRDVHLPSPELLVALRVVRRD